MTNPSFDAILLSKKDNVVCLLRSMKAGERPRIREESSPALVQNTGLGHKIARFRIAAGAPVLKYGHVIGQAMQDISPGEHVHLHNLIGPDNVGGSGR
jgi:hypothetical protein